MFYFKERKKKDLCWCRQGPNVNVRQTLTVRSNLNQKFNTH